MTIYFATDHAGFTLKNALLSYVSDELGYEVEDCGALILVEGDDYPDYITVAAGKVSENPETSKAIILGGSGQGEAIAANKVSGVRAALYYGGPHEIVTLSREHNDANVLSLGARFVSETEAKEVVKTWLETPFSGDIRHIRRIKKIEGNI
jgi:ribose 5-phosphate isomerase B